MGARRLTPFPRCGQGLHHSPAVPRRDVWRGTTVKIAARIAAPAAEGRLLASLASLAIADGAAVLGVPRRPLGVATRRGLPGATTRATSRDPVSGRVVSRPGAVRH